ncbi:MAG: UDP-N-acetylglucosamine 1-carboxyvinyltransferase [Acidobacteriota bacterium]
MECIRIAGRRTLSGTVSVSGAKNAVLPALAATLLTDEEIVLHNVPDVVDVATMLRVLEHLGAQGDRDSGTVRIRTPDVRHPEAPYRLVRTMRASILTLGPLLARHGKARVSRPGGCAIGARPVDLHLEVMRAMGAQVNLQHGYIESRAGRLQGARFTFPTPTVTGTENAMMAATLARGQTRLEHCAREPEIDDLAVLLNRMGARIAGAGTGTMTIDGVEKLRGAEHQVIPDRIEAGTFLCAGALAGGLVTVAGCRPDHLKAVLQALRSCGVSTEIGPGSITIKGGGDLAACDVTTRAYPGFPTDLQAQYMVLMTQAAGKSVISETIFENRFMHVSELQRMGARIRVHGRQATVEGKRPLSGAPVMATDLRASASLVLAGLIASGETLVRRVYHLDRGYENLETKLRSLGAEISRIRE